MAIRIEKGSGRVLDVRVSRKGELLPVFLPETVNDDFARGVLEPLDGDSRWVVRLVTEEGDF